MLANLELGLTTAMSLDNLFYCFLGTLLGTAVGVMPGLGPLATISLLLPISFGLEPSSALIMLAGIYYGAQYGGSTTAILVNLPGEASSVVTAIDGHQMAKQGKAGKALAGAAIGSFVAGTVGTVLVAFFAPILVNVVLLFGAPEFFSLIVLGLTASIVLAHGSLLHALAMVVVGLILGLVGTDSTSGIARFTFGVLDLYDGIDFVVIAMGIFGIGEVVKNLSDQGSKAQIIAKATGLLPSKDDFKRMVGPILRGTGIGSILGLLPGGGAMIASFASYAMEKRLSKHPEEFGHGAFEGVVGPESANNAAAQTSFIPMLTLGLPSNPVMALMIGAMMIHGIQPGPSIMTQQPALFWGLITSMWIGNFFLLILNLPLISIWVRLISIPYHFLYPAILALCCIGVFSIGNSVFDVYLMAVFGVIGYIFSRIGVEAAPLLMGFILGPMMEEWLRRTMLLSRGDPSVFFTHPLSATLLAVAAGLLILVCIPAARNIKEQAIVVDD